MLRTIFKIGKLNILQLLLVAICFSAMMFLWVTFVVASSRGSNTRKPAWYLLDDKDIIHSREKLLVKTRRRIIVNGSDRKQKTFNSQRNGSIASSSNTIETKETRDRPTQHETIRNFVTKPKVARSSREESEQVHECQFIQHRLFPLCTEKAEYIKSNWKMDKCLHERHNITGSQCSVYRYLTKVEPFCMGKQGDYETEVSSITGPRFDLEGLLTILSEVSLKWMRDRARFIFPSWVKAEKSFSKKRRKYKNRRVIAFMGAFIMEPKLLSQAGRGGPLGELIQWTDLITGLYVLGYNVTVTIRTEDFKEYILGDNKMNCPDSNYKKTLDIIYTDIAGMFLLRERFGEKRVSRYKCTYRVLDSFGTFAEYNYPSFPITLSPDELAWSNYDLLLPQYLTLYPHTHDNSFLGFVVHDALNSTSLVKRKKDRALLYAKRTSYVDNDNKRFLKIVSEYFEIHATSLVDGGNVSGLNIHNHGPVSGAKVQELLSQSKLFIGIGFPYEGPGPLEAMAAGTVYLQPKFNVPVGKQNTDFFASKPNRRELTSQNPYMEEYVGKPYCHTINVKDERLLRNTLLKIKRRKNLPSKIPKEFKSIGMIERIYATTSLVDYCNPHAPRWPPLNNLQEVLGLIGESCKDTCLAKGLVCEPSYFDDINSISVMETHSGEKCKLIKSMKLLNAPSFDPTTKTCYLQNHGRFFSCMHREKDVKAFRVRRLCPCRDYEVEQTAICKNCL